MAWNKFKTKKPKLGEMLNIRITLDGNPIYAMGTYLKMLKKKDIVIHGNYGLSLEFLERKYRDFEWKYIEDQK